MEANDRAADGKPESDASGSRPDRPVCELLEDRAPRRRPTDRRCSPRPMTTRSFRSLLAHSRTTVPAGVCLAAFSSRLPSACSTSAASTLTSGRSFGSSTMTRCDASRSLMRPSAELATSAIDVQSRSIRISPVSSRVIWSTFVTRSAMSRDCSKMLLASAWRSWRRVCLPLRPDVDDAPAMTASGVRRSCEIDASNALRIRLGLCGDLQRRLLPSLPPHTRNKMRDHQSDRQHDREREHVLQVVDREGSSRGTNSTSNAMMHRIDVRIAGPRAWCSATSTTASRYTIAMLTRSKRPRIAKPTSVEATVAPTAQA